MTVCDCSTVCQFADRFQPATRELMVFTKSKTRYFDLDAVREPYSQASLDRFADGKGMKFDKAANEGRGGGWSTFTEGRLTQSGAPPLDWWNIPRGEVVARLVKAMCPSRVCRTCGKPSRRIVGEAEYTPSATHRGGSSFADSERLGEGVNQWSGANGALGSVVRNAPTLGFSDCGHDDWRPGVVLDPFTDSQGEPMSATFYVGDAIETMNALPEKSVDLILTSPPFLALRSYLPADHPDKALEGGSQSTPGEYLDWLLDVVEACDRVLAPHGSLVFELGDTYSGSGGAGGDYDPEGLREGQPKFRQTANWGDGKWSDSAQSNRSYGSGKGTGWPLAKSLSLVPESFRWAMVYGHNPFTGRECATWRLRNVIRWVRPNPPVGALGDKFRPATSELMVFCKAKDRFFDLDAVRTPTETMGEEYRPGRKPIDDKNPSHGWRDAPQRMENPAGAPPLDWWSVPLLDGEETILYGPKPERPKTRAEKGMVGKVDQRDTERAKVGLSSGKPGVENNPAGAPPLDWWNIPLLDGEEETRYGPKEPKPIKEGIFNGPKAQTPSEDHGRGTYGFTERTTNPAGSPPLDWWNIPPGGYSGAHYAVFPPELLIKPIKAMCPEKVCKTCGEPSRRIVESLVVGDYADRPGWREHRTTKAGGALALAGPGGNTRSESTTLGFSDCGHDDWRPGLVLDPFGGSGTTALVATGHGRDCILIDLDERNYELALERVGPFILTLAETDTPPT